MSRRMIDEGALSSQIQEAITTKQDKLVPDDDKSIIIEPHGIPEVQVISSKVRIYTSYRIIKFHIEAKTYEVGDVITSDSGDSAFSGGLFVSPTYSTLPVFTINDNMKAIPCFRTKNSSTQVSLVIIKGGTVATAFDTSVNCEINMIKNWSRA